MPLMERLISQPSYDVSRSWTTIIATETRKLQLRPLVLCLPQISMFAPWKCALVSVQYLPERT
jgi:hypothetical protein